MGPHSDSTNQVLQKGKKEVIRKRMGRGWCERKRSAAGTDSAVLEETEGFLNMPSCLPISSPPVNSYLKEPYVQRQPPKGSSAWAVVSRMG